MYFFILEFKDGLGNWYECSFPNSCFGQIKNWVGNTSLLIPAIQGYMQKEHLQQKIGNMVYDIKLYDVNKNLLTSVGKLPV